MKKVLLSLAIAVAIFSYSNVQAEYTFTLTSSSFSIHSYLHTPLTNTSYDKTSKIPFYGGLSDLYANASSQVGYNSIIVSVNTTNQDDYALVATEADIHFRPNFNGQHIIYLDVGWDNYDRNCSVSIRDLNNGVEIWSGVNYTGGAFNYAWNTANEYELKMAAEITRQLSDGRSGGTVDVGTTMVFKPVPIPPSILLLGSGLIGLIGIKRKYLG